MYKSYYIRIYPTKEQEELIWKHIHACRFIWNYMIEQQQKSYNDGNGYISQYNMNKLLTPLKKQDEYSWLNEVSNRSLQIVCRDLDFRYKRFFNKKSKYPKFKSSKKDRKSYPVRENVFCFLDDHTIRVEKLRKVRCRRTDVPIGKICNPRIFYANKKWMIYFVVECENQAPICLSEFPMGIDLGIKEFAVVSFGSQKFVFHNINKSKRVRALEHKLRYIKKVLARKYKVNNYVKTKSTRKYEAMQSELYYKLSNIRHNYINQVINQLIKCAPYKITVEDLDLAEWSQKRIIADSAAHQNIGRFISRLSYKCEWNGIKYLKADRYFPSSKMCSNCGNIKKYLSVGARIYNCKKCGLRIDRDYNAAINLMKYVPQNARVTA